MKANIRDVRILQILNWLIFDLNIFFSTDSYAFVRPSYLDLLRSIDHWVYAPVTYILELFITSYIISEEYFTKAAWLYHLG